MDSSQWKLYLYYASFLVGYVVAFFINLITFYKYKTTQKRVWLYSLTFVYGFLGAMVGAILYNQIYHSLVNSILHSKLALFGAVVLVPVFEIVTVLIEKQVRGAVNRNRIKTGLRPPLPPVSVRDTLDMLAPNVFLVIAFGKIGCHINGCCFGIECGFGIERVLDKKPTHVFPVQLLEAGLIFLMLILVYFLKQRPFYRRGMAYPLTAACYCVIRFGVEFLRWYEPEMRHAVLGMTLWQFCSILVFLSSLISLFILYRTGASAPLPKSAAAARRAESRTSRQKKKR